MPFCIFCPAPLTPDVKPEHILQDAFGGRMKTYTADCSSCNERFGGTIDHACALQVLPLRNLLQLRSGSGDQPPRLPRVQAGKLTLSIAADGAMQLIGKPFEIEKQADGSWRMQIHARSAEHLRSLLPNIAAQIGISTEELSRQMVASASITEHVIWPDPVGLPLQLGTPESLRSMTKSALVLWSTLVGNDEIRSAPYAAAREFVTDGDENFARMRTHLDTRRVPFAAEAVAAFGPLFNLIYVRSDDVGKVIGHFTLYNLLGWRLVLAERGGAPNQRIALISNPEQPRDWSDNGANLFDLPLEWLARPERDVDMARSRMIDMNRHYCLTAGSRHISRIIDEAALALGYGPDQPVPPDRLQALVATAVGRIGQMFMRLSQEQPFTAEQIAAFVRKT